eukprot:c24418_g1_i1 orf=279-845(-)
MEGYVQRRRFWSVFAATLVLCVGVCVKLSDGAAADLSTCPDALTKLLPCLPYSQGTSEVPTKDCCTNLLTIHETKPQCLCALIAASVNGTAGLPKMNTTLSLQLGPACKVATKPAVCPELLGLSPDDPVAKIFTSGTAGTNSTTSAAPGPVATGTAGPKAPPPDNKASPLSFSLPASFLLAIAAFALF